MKMKLKFVFSFLLLIGTALAAEETPEINKRTTTTLPPPTTTTPAPTSSSTASTTTTQPTSTSTSAPTTPTPTTPTPTTPVSSTIPTTTTPTPKPPKPEKWEVNDPHRNITCILAMMDAEFIIHDKSYTSDPIKIDPSQANAEGGTCEGNTQILKVVWKTGNFISFMALSFTKNNKDYSVSGLNASIAYNTSAGYLVSNFSDSNIKLFPTSLNSSYHCSSNEIVTKNSKNETLNVNLSKIYLEAFRLTNSTNFSSSHLCTGDIPDVVPLVVGIALAGLVLVVVIAYLIGRRRSQARGYLSM